MLLFKKNKDLQSFLQNQKKEKLSIGFVPTMGALHAGHISLINQSKAENDITVCSIFVNPTQFNDPKDLAKYPRTYAADTTLLYDANCDILYCPDVEDIYPSDLDLSVNLDLHGLDLVMEGLHRPGHFNGVVQVVYRLLDIVKPDRLYMGQKDFQQFTIIGHMIKTLQLPVILIVCPILREENGLAMSSRNTRLSTEAREKAGLIYQTLKEMRSIIPNHSPFEVATLSLEKLNHLPFKPEYFEIINSSTLLPLTKWTENTMAVACTAVWLEGVRLIDNEILNI